ncbi:hypothetical protein D3C72_1538420 [compost metagenome]
MSVGQQDFVDLLRQVARRAQVGAELTQGRAHQAAGPRVDEHQLVAGVDQVGIDGGLHRAAQMVGAQVAADVARMAVQQFLGRQLDGAVAQGGDFERTEHHAVEPRRLCFHHGCCRLNGWRQHCAAGCECHGECGLERKGTKFHDRFLGGLFQRVPMIQ